MNFAEIKGLSVFKPGEHNGELFTDDDMTTIVNGYNATQSAFKRPVRFTHKDKNNDIGKGLAMGMFDRMFVSNIDNEPHVMVDLSGVPEGIAQAVNDKRILDRSIELYKKFNHDGKTYNWVPRALAFLGDEIPGVKGLPPLEKYFSEDEPEFIKFSCSTAKAAGSKTINKKQENKMDPIKITLDDGSVREFKTAADVLKFSEQRAKEAASDMVPKAELDALKADKAKADKALAFAEAEKNTDSIIHSFKELAKPNKDGKAIPNSVLKIFQDISTTLPHGANVLSFGEGKEQKNLQEKITDGLRTLRDTGFVDFQERSPSGDGNKEIDNENPKLRAAFDGLVKTEVFEEKDWEIFKEQANG